MTKVCSRCETENTDAAKVCKLCGTPFAPPAGGSSLLGQRASPPPAPPAPPEDRTVDQDEVTVMASASPVRRSAATPASAPATGGSGEPDPLLGLLGADGAAGPASTPQPASSAALAQPPGGAAGMVAASTKPSSSRKGLWIGVVGALLVLVVGGTGAWFSGAFRSGADGDAAMPVSATGPAGGTPGLAVDAARPPPATAPADAPTAAAPATEPPVEASLPIMSVLPPLDAPGAAGSVSATQRSTPVARPAEPAPRSQVAPAAPAPAYRSAPAAPAAPAAPVTPAQNAAPLVNAGSPQEACSNQSFLARPFCMHEQCATSRFRGHAQCQKLREDQLRGG